MLVRASRPHRRLTLARTVLAAAFAIGMAAPVAAEDGFHPLDATLKFMGIKTDTGTMPDFVQQSRPDIAKESYLAVGNKPVDRALKPKSAAEVKAATAELDAAHAAQLGGKRPKPVAAAAPAKPVRREAETSH